ncbi:MAG: response regulator transcription factor [Anaerolineae bacterium]|jgi:DNA-binding NarL/FixJ family response regulator|nr:response regulator transcription factor [Anaerolineae bacterium]
MIRILLVDDQVLFREALRTLISEQTDFVVVGEAGNGEEAVNMISLLKPSIILMDLRMPIMGGVEATRKIRQDYPDCKVIMLTTFDDDELVFDGLKAGAIGYLLKDVSSEKLFEAIHTANEGQYVLHPSITGKVVEEFSRLRQDKPTKNQAIIFEQLSPREIEILELVAKGSSNKEIADYLYIAEGTVKNHMRNILSKLDARDRMQAVIKAKEAGIIQF